MLVISFKTATAEQFEHFIGFRISSRDLPKVRPS